jgi:hypothetical protein
VQPGPRAVLSNPIAEVLESILSSLGGDLSLTPEERPFLFCPRCASKLEQLEDGDLYVQALRCRNQHRWGARGRHLGTAQEPKINLWHDLSESSLRQSAFHYAETSEPTERSMVPFAIQALLREFLATP